MSVTIHTGDCRDVLAGMPEASVDSCVTDPPYGLSFMGMGWDRSVPGAEFWQAVYRVLKPGAYLLAFGGTRTYHRLACAIEDAGFEVVDMLAWTYGSGFPKSHNIDKHLDDKCRCCCNSPMVSRPHGQKVAPDGEDLRGLRDAVDPDNAVSSRPEPDVFSGVCAAEPVPEHGGEEPQPQPQASGAWHHCGRCGLPVVPRGFGSALKPAIEPICVARKPRDGTIIECFLTHGTGAINVDACRVGDNAGWSYPNGRGGSGWHGRESLAQNLTEPMSAALGRWPANLIHDGSDEVLACFPNAPGQLARESSSSRRRKDQNVYGSMARGSRGREPRADTGSAARFFYCAKASKAERGEGNDHPTVKPLALMRYLVRLVTPPGGHVLDPFAGSGTTGLAASIEQFDATLIEFDPRHAAIASRRINQEAGLFAPAAE